jgi:SAM-dependent methyltransferase
MPKERALDYVDELEAQRRAWERKPALRSVYRAWYEQIAAQLSPVGPTVEVGSGSGNFKEFLPDIVATDVINSGDWLDSLADARHLPFGDGTVGNIVLADALHHFTRPFDFLRDAARSLKPGGRLILLEPAATPWARLVLGLFHHEPVDLKQDVFGEDGSPPPENAGFTFANQAFATLLFVNDPDETARRVPELELKEIQRSDFVVWPATGGFSYFCLVPAKAAPVLQRLENRFVSRTGKVTAMRLIIVLERRSD